MNVFARRREDEEFPRPGATPARMPAQPSAPAPAFAAPPPSETMSVTAHGSTTIGRTVVIKGEVRCEEDLLIDGQLEGKLELGQHRLVVGPNGTVRAAIGAREVEVQGAVNGNVEAAERIILRKNAKLVGDLKMASVVIEDGAYFKGNIEITRPQEANSAARTAVVKPPAA